MDTMNKLFTAVAEAYDPKNNIVFLCRDAAGFYVYKPSTGYKSRHGVEQEATAWFDRQVLCGHTHSFYNEAEAPADGELYEQKAIPAANMAVAPAKAGKKKHKAKK